jgi:hypothetical protein
MPLYLHRLAAPLAAATTAALLALAVAPAARAQQTDRSAAMPAAVAAIRGFSPATTRVAILPVIDTTGEKDDQRRDQANAARREAYDQFYQRGFQVIDEATVARAVAESGIDFADEEEHRKDNVYKIGRAVDADLVVFVVVSQAYAKVRETTVGEQREGLARTKTWLLDAREQNPLLSAYVREGKSSGLNVAGAKSIRGRMGAAAGNAVRDTLNDVLAPFARDKSKRWPAGDLASAQK